MTTIDTSKVTRNNALVLSILSFAPPCELGKAGRVNKSWSIAANTHWVRTMSRPRAEVMQLFNAHDRIIRLVRSRDALANYFDRSATAIFNIGLVSVLIFCIGLLTTIILAVNKADRQAKSPWWLVNLPVVVCGTPVAFIMCLYGCFLLAAGGLFCWRKRVHREISQIGPLMYDDAEFTHMTRAMLSDSVRAGMQHARNAATEQSTNLATLWRSLDMWDMWGWGLSLDVCILFTVLPIWLCATVSSNAIPMLVSLAPLYISCIAAVVCVVLQDRRIAQRNLRNLWHERLALLWVAAFITLLGVSIFVLGLYLDGLLHSPFAAAVLLCVCVTIFGLGFTVLAGPMLCESRENSVAGKIIIFLLWAFAISSVYLGIAASLEKEIGGALAVIPYSVIVLVLFMHVPCCCLTSTLYALYL